MGKDDLVRPFVRWAGGKGRLLKTLWPLFPAGFSEYYEPFAGGGAVLLALRPAAARVSDVNRDLICAYSVIRDDVEALIGELGSYKNDEGFFYALRGLDRDPERRAALSDVERAARLLYLNRTCYNGLYRVNGAGEFNVPFGRRKVPDIVGGPVLRAVSAYFNSADVRFSSADFADALEGAGKGAFAYLDPPYDHAPGAAGFTGYAKGGFTRDDQVRLRECCDALTERGARFMLSNAATDFVLDQYSAYDVTIVRARRSIGGGRGYEDEVVVRNYR